MCSTIGKIQTLKNKEIRKKIVNVNRGTIEKVRLFGGVFGGALRVILIQTFVQKK